MFRLSRNKSTTDLNVLSAAWFTAAPLLGGFGKDAQGGNLQPAALAAGRTWAVATPVALAIRGISRGYVPPTPFIVVAFVATGVLMIGWRSALASVTTPEVSASVFKIISFQN